MAFTVVELADFVKPSGVIAVRVVAPTAKGVNCAAPCSEPPLMMTGVDTLPTDEFWFSTTTVNDMPARSGCTVMSAERRVTGSRCAVQTLRFIGVPFERWDTKADDPDPPS